MKHKVKAKILFVSFQANRTGAPRALHNVIKNLDRQKFEAHVVFPRHRYTPTIIPEFETICTTYLIDSYEILCLPSMLNRQVRKILRRRAFERIVARVSPDIIFLNTIGHSDVAGWALELEIPKVIYVHEFDSDVMRMDQEWLSRISARCDLFIGASRAVSEFLVRCLDVRPGKVITANGIDTAELNARVRQPVEEVKKSLGLSADTVLVGAVGKPLFGKGVDLFIESAALVRSAHPEADIHFVWVGGNPRVHTGLFLRSMRSLVQHYGLEDRFHWVQELPDPSSLQAAMSVCVVPSRVEAFGMAAAEAMLLGTPIITFSRTGIADSISDLAGIVVDQMCPQALAEAIQKLLKEHDQWLSFAAQRRAMVVERFDISKRIPSIEAALLKLTNHHMESALSAGAVAQISVTTNS